MTFILPNVNNTPAIIFLDNTNFLGNTDDLKPKRMFGWANENVVSDQPLILRELLYGGLIKSQIQICSLYIIQKLIRLSRVDLFDTGTLSSRSVVLIS